MVTYKLYHGDCLEVMATLDAGTIDCVLTDPPYGTTACSWDTIIPFDTHIIVDGKVRYFDWLSHVNFPTKEKYLEAVKIWTNSAKHPGMWKAIKRVRKPRAAVVLFGSEPFSSMLRVSNLKEYKYDWIWDKVAVTSPMLAKLQPMRILENISVFYDVQPTYNPQMKRGKRWKRSGKREHKTGTTGSAILINNGDDKTDIKYPKNLLKFSNADKSGNIHPTQKPVALLRYLIRTYTNEGDTILDFTCGSGSAGVAAMLEHRNYIGIDDGHCEKENSEWNGKRWVDVAEWRIKNAAGDFTMTDTEKETGQMSIW